MDPFCPLSKRKPYFLGYFARQHSRRTTGIYFGANVIFLLYLKRPLGITRPYLPTLTILLFFRWNRGVHCTRILF